MEAVIEFIFAGMRKFAGEIIGAVMVTVLLWLFPGFRKIFMYKNANDAEILRQENEKLSRLKDELKRNKEALERTESKTAEEIQKIHTEQSQPRIKLDYGKISLAVFFISIALCLLFNGFATAALAVYYSWYFFVYRS